MKPVNIIHMDSLGVPHTVHRLLVKPDESHNTIIANLYSEDIITNYEKDQYLQPNSVHAHDLFIIDDTKYEKLMDVEFITDPQALLLDCVPQVADMADELKYPIPIDEGDRELNAIDTQIEIVQYFLADVEL